MFRYSASRQTRREKLTRAGQLVCEELERYQSLRFSTRARNCLSSNRENLLQSLLMSSANTMSVSSMITCDNMKTHVTAIRLVQEELESKPVPVRHCQVTRRESAASLNRIRRSNERWESIQPGSGWQTWGRTRNKLQTHNIITIH